jgi:hypothetical protein
LLSADILALLLQLFFAEPLLWNVSMSAIARILLQKLFCRRRQKS